MSSASVQAIPCPTIMTNACDSKANNTWNNPQNVSSWEEDLYPVLPFPPTAPESQGLRVDRQSYQPKVFYSSEPEQLTGESESESEWECVTSFSPMAPRQRFAPSRVVLVDLGYLSPESRAPAEAASVAVTAAGPRARKPKAGKASPTANQGSRSNRTTGRAGRTSLPARASMSAAAAAVVQARSQTARSLTARSKTARSQMAPSRPQRRVSASAVAAVTQRSWSDSRLQPECPSSTSSSPAARASASGAFRRGEALALDAGGDARRSPRHQQAGSDTCHCSNSAPESPLSRAAQLCAQYLNSLEVCR